MKKRKRRILIIIAILVAVFLSFMIGTGFTKRTDVALGGYSVSEDGKTLTFQAGVTSSMGYTRGFKDNGGGVKPHYLTFYSTFGGLNSSFGAKREFTLVLDENDTEIYFGRVDGGYELVLQKDVKTGKWMRPEHIQNVSVVNTYEKTDSALVEDYLDNGKLIVIVQHYEMSDGTWRTDEQTYQYRLEITGRMNNAAKDSTFVILSNIKEITFDQAWKASGLSSNMDDYFDVEDAKFVAMK